MKGFIIGWLVMAAIAILLSVLLQFGFKTIAVILAVGVMVIWVLASISGGGDRGNNHNENNL
jgi:hypothetical protein